VITTRQALDDRLRTVQVTLFSRRPGIARHGSRQTRTTRHIPLVANLFLGRNCNVDGSAALASPISDGSLLLACVFLFLSCSCFACTAFSRLSLHLHCHCASVRLRISFTFTAFHQTRPLFVRSFSLLHTMYRTNILSTLCISLLSAYTVKAAATCQQTTFNADFSGFDVHVSFSCLSFATKLTTIFLFLLLLPLYGT
jgi:hypothetical protein